VHVYKITIVFVNNIHFLFLCREVDLDHRDNLEQTPLLSAAASNNFKVTEMLINKGADVTVTDMFERNIIHLTATYGAVDVLKVRSCIYVNTE